MAQKKFLNWFGQEKKFINKKMPPKIAQIPIKKDEDATYRYKMPRLTSRKLSSGNGVKTSIINSAEIAKAIGRTQALLTQWFGYHLACQARINPTSSQIVLNGDHPVKKLQDSIYEFIDNFILCPCCSNPETTMDKKGNQLILHCHSCGHSDPACQNGRPNYIQKTYDWILSHLQSEQTKGENVTQRAHGRLDEIDEFQKQKADEQNDGSTGIEINVDELKKIEAEIVAKNTKQPEKPTEEEENAYFEKFGKQLVGEETDLEIFEEFNSMADRGGWNAPTRCSIIINYLFKCPPEEILNVMMDRRAFLIRILNDDDIQKDFQNLVANYIEKTEPKLFTSAPVIWHFMYENEIIEETAFNNWYAHPSKRFEKPDKAKALRDLLIPFKDWLKNAELEPDPEDFDDEEPAAPEQEEAAEKIEDKSYIDDI